MEKLNQPISKDLPITILYLDEIKEIWELLELNKKERGVVQVKTNEYTFQNVQELQNLPLEKIHFLEIHSSDPYISIELRSNSTRLYASEDTNEMIGLVTKIEAILLKGKRLIENFISKPYWTWIIALPLGVTLGMLPNKKATTFL